MLRRSFRSLAGRVYPRPGGSKLATAAAAALLGVALAGCGGGGQKRTAPPPPQRVAGVGYGFQAPGGWHVTRAPARLALAPKGDDVSLLGVSTYRLLKPYRAALFARTARELDAVAARFARALHGRVAARRTVRVAGQRVRQYDVDYGRATPLVQRTTFLLRGLREYQLTCRFAAADRERPLDGACARFLETFRLAAPPA